MITSIAIATLVGITVGSLTATITALVQRRSVEAQVRRSFRAALKRWEDDQPNRDAAAIERLQRIAEESLTRALAADRQTSQRPAATDTRLMRAVQ